MLKHATVTVSGQNYSLQVSGPKCSLDSSSETLHIVLVLWDSEVKKPGP